MNFSIDYYQGMIPLFVQWTDIHVHAISADRDPSLNVKCKSLHENMLHELNQVLRPNVLYFTVVQDDQGLYELLLLLKS